MSWLLVTPARNEAANLPHVAAGLAAQAHQPVARWVIVDDGSTDGTGSAVGAGELPFPVDVVRREGRHGLRQGAAFAAFLHGAAFGLPRASGVHRVMKLDADVVLAPDYFAALDAADHGEGILGGVIAGEREQLHHVRGALKGYSRAALAIVQQLPPALAFDVMDEVAVRQAGLTVAAVPAAQARTLRTTGVTEGRLAGRVRNGTASRWAGYDPLYFAARLVRYATRPPYAVGALAMAYGYATSGTGPYHSALRRAHAAEQRARLAALARRPLATLRSLYGGT